jgi:hypothetical protein
VLAVDDFAFNDEAKLFEFESWDVIELSIEPGESLATAWRRRYPVASQWMSRREEAEWRKEEAMLRHRHRARG